jgi:preprotein translocase subunit SecY
MVIMGTVIDFMHSVAKALPEVKTPAMPPTTQQRLMWTGVALLIFFLMYNTTAYGIRSQLGGVDFLQTVTASKLGTLLTAGIGPIVLASIFLQLFVGAGVIKLNLQDKSDKQKFQEVQKILAIVLAFVEATMFAIGGVRGQLIDPSYGAIAAPLVVLQIALGSILLLYLDEIVSKYGLGSGISLFIAAGVSFSIVAGAVQLVLGDGGVISSIQEVGAEGIPRAMLILLPLIFTAIVFIIAVYAEGVKVEIPIAFERVRGLAPRLPLKYFYVSNIPVIFASAFIQSVVLFSSLALQGNAFPWIGYIDPSNRLIDGILYFITPPLHLIGQTPLFTLWNQSTQVFAIPEIVHAITYILFLSTASVLFGIFWIETSNMDAKSVAKQLTDSGMQIPGFRSDPRMLETILNKHITPLTIMGSLSVGLLAGMADLLGALGTGTGILLTVGILYRMFEQMEQLKMFDLYPMLGKIAGE